MSSFSLSSPVLAFSLDDTKQVVLCGVEKAEILHVFPLQNSVTCMHWMEVMEDSRYAQRYGIRPVAQRTSDHPDANVLSFHCAVVPSVHSATQKMNPSFFSPSYQLYPRGNASVRYTDPMSEFYTADAGLILKFFFLKLFLHSYSTTSKIFR